MILQIYITLDLKLRKSVKYYLSFFRDNYSTFQDLQKLIIMYIYLKENVLRDNLVQLKIKRNYQSAENSNYIYKLLTGEYVIVLNYYKNQINSIWDIR